MWSAAGTPVNARTWLTSTLLPNGKVLVVGGNRGAFTWFSQAELYDPATNTWSATGGLGGLRSNHTAMLLQGGKLLIAGGTNTVTLSSTELYW